MLVKFVLFITLIISPQLALSQIYKCKNSSGKTIYSEATCASGTKGFELYLETNVIDSSALRDRIAREKIYKSTVTEQSITSNNSEYSDNLMPDFDKHTRLRSLQIDMHDDNGTYEKKADAKTEQRYLSSDSVHSLSYSDEVLRRNLKIDLVSPDQSKRSSAMRSLDALYTKYQYP